MSQQLNELNNVQIDTVTDINGVSTVFIKFVIKMDKKKVNTFSDKLIKLSNRYAK